MGPVVELRRPRASAAERARETTSAIGMMVALGSFGMMFACLFFMYAALRSQSLAWPPPGLPALPVALPACNTAVMVASSFALHRAEGCLRAGARTPALAWTAATVALGLVFIGLQVALWYGLWRAGITTSTGALGTVVYALTALHALHVAAGIVALGYLLAIAARGAQPGQKVTVLRLCAMFWHFVGAVWGVMFVGLFLL